MPFGTLPFFFRGQGRSKIGCGGFCSRNFFHRLSQKTTKTSAQSKNWRDLKVILFFCSPHFYTVILFLGFPNYHRNRHTHRVNNVHFRILKGKLLKNYIILNLVLILWEPQPYSPLWLRFEKRNFEQQMVFTVWRRRQIHIIIWFLGTSEWIYHL